MGRPEKRKQELKTASKRCKSLENFFFKLEKTIEDNSTDPQETDKSGMSKNCQCPESKTDSMTETLKPGKSGTFSDIGNVINANMTVPEINNAIEQLSQGEKYKLIKQHTRPLDTYNFPKVYQGGCNRCFKLNWLNEHQWLVYSEALDGAFCIPCALFCKNRVGKGQLVNKPFINWQKKSEKFKEHETNSYHQEAMTTADSLVRAVEKPSDTVRAMIDSQKIKNIEKNREILRCIADAIVYCGKQGIALRGRTQSKNPGNFLALIKLLSKYNKTLQQHLQDPQMKCVSYVSPQTQNELLDVIGNEMILSDLAKEVKEARFYSIMADEVTSHNTEQLALCVRFVDCNDDIREEFVTFTNVLRTTGEYLAREIQQQLQKLGIPLKDMRGQGYDGASNMSSARIGVQKRIRDHAPLATYVHCSGHCLNLVISHSCALPVVRNMIDKLKTVCLFFLNSPKRNELLEIITKFNVQDETKRKSLIDLCRTRWAERQNAYQHFYLSFPFIIETLEVIAHRLHLEEYQIEDLYTDWSTQTRSDAQQILAGITSFEFVAVFITVYQYLSHLSGVTVLLQSSSLDIIHAYTLMEDIKAVYKEEREKVADHYETIFQQIERMAARIGIDPCMPRVTKRQKHRSNAPTCSVLDHFRVNLAIPFLDHVNENLESQFSGLSRTATALLGLVPSVICHETFSLEETLQVYADDLPSPEVCELELMRWKARYEKVSEDERPSSPATALKDCDKALFPNIKTLLKIACTIPVTSCECERSASSLRRLHSYLRATMNQERLAALALINIHYNKHIDLDRVVDIFAKMHPRRLELSSILAP